MVALPEFADRSSLLQDDLPFDSPWGYDGETSIIAFP